jgi:hypothetical protein
MADTIEIEINGKVETIPAPVVPVYSSGGNIQILEQVKQSK